jgi:cytochrome P450 / NADPH-cytochrome P450 reductase
MPCVCSGGNNYTDSIHLGHETTSGLLSFLFYELLDNPSTMSTLVEEVDSVLGKDPMTVNHLTKLPYLEACLRETLRLHSPAPAFTLQAIGDQVVGGEYEIKDGDHATILLDPLHRDPEVWGEDADDFKPERMLEENFKKLPRNAWKVIPYAFVLQGP